VDKIGGNIPLSSSFVNTTEDKCRRRLNNPEAGFGAKQKINPQHKAGGFWILYPSLTVGARFFLFSSCFFVVSFKGLLDKAHTDCLSGDLYPANRPVDNRPHLLDVRLKSSFGYAGYFSADAAKVFGLASPDYASSKTRLLSRKKTNSRHLLNSYCFLSKAFEQTTKVSANIQVYQKIARPKPLSTAKI
jgi:hypothetical protein